MGGSAPYSILLPLSIGRRIFYRFTFTDGIFVLSFVRSFFLASRKVIDPTAALVDRVYIS